MRRSAGALASVLFGAILWTACSAPETQGPSETTLVDQSTLSNVTQHCEAGGVKTEVKDGFSYGTKTYSYDVGSICVKAGTKVYTTKYNGTFGYGCYKVYGLGTYSVTIKETGYAGCKDISYFMIYKKKSYSY